jgi:hypothetical protein
MRWVPVESSAFRAAAYGDDEHSLYLRFRSGEVYRYFDVPAQVYQEFLAADSKGRYFRQNILDRFAYQQMHKTRHAAN